MPIRVVKPNTSAQRAISYNSFTELTKGISKRSYKSLLITKKQKAGRNNQGRITVRHRGGGAKRKIRVIDFALNQGDYKIIGNVYDPNRSANLSLIEDSNNKKAFTLSVDSYQPGQNISFGAKADIKEGNRLPLSRIPVGSFICNIEITPGKGSCMVRSAGTKAQLVAKDGQYAQVKLPSGEVRLISCESFATMGRIGNVDHSNIRIGSAGRKRRMGRRPQVRGKAMNPVDHPHGGGEGSNSIGLVHPKTPSGLPALGRKTRNNKVSQKYIIRKRKG